MSQKYSRMWMVRAVGAGTVVGVLTVAGLASMAGVAYAVVPTLSQTSVTVGVGQSVSVTSENGTNVYMESNSASTVASVAVNGTQVTITGLSPGSASLAICGTGTASDCTNLSVTVQVGSASGLSFSQNNLSLAIGGSQSITISGGNGTYSISSNSNTSAVSANLSSNTLTISGLVTGSATINICDGTGSTCGSLSVAINSSGSGLTFSQNNLSLATGGSQVVSITGGNGAYNISSDSNAAVASVGMSGSTSIIVDAASPGSATITVCDTSNTNKCGTLSVTVTGSTTTTSANQAVTFSTTNPTLASGQSINITLSGSAPSYFVSSVGNSSILQATVNNGTTLSLSGENSGTTSVTVCATGGAGCDQLPVTVTGSSGTSATTPATSVTPPPTTTTTQTTGTVVANTALLTEIQSLQAAVTQALTQIESIQAQLNQLEGQVSAGSGSSLSTGVSAGTSSGSSPEFTELLTLGSEDAQVTALQQRLTSLGFYSGPITGYYGSLTEQAVMKYQTAHGIEALGDVGPSTRAALNAGN